MEAHDGRQQSRLQAQLASVKLLMIGELGYAVDQASFMRHGGGSSQR
jgi:hypothetical protein